MEAEQITVRSPIWARLQSVEEEYAKLVAERDQARAERDAARAVLEPFLAQLDELKALIVAQMPKAPKDTRLPSVRKHLPGRAQKTVPDDQLSDWCTRHIGGESINRIADSAGVAFETVKMALVRAGIEIHVQRQGPHLPEDKTASQPFAPKAGQCRKCGLELDSLVLVRDDVRPAVDGVCGLCQIDQEELAAKRAKGNGDVAE